MVKSRIRDLFISHAWRYHDDWKRLVDLLDAYDPYVWRNFSLPWFDPALNPATDSGAKTLRWSLESQIIPVHAMILLSSVFAQPASRKWIDFEIETAHKHSKPIVALPVWGDTTVPAEVAAIAGWTGVWEIDALLAMVDLAASASCDTQKTTSQGANAAPVEE